MKIEKTIMDKTLAITLSMAFAILTTMNGAAQEQKDPFKNAVQPTAGVNIVKPAAGTYVTSQARKRLLDKLNNIIIEKIEFQNANIKDVISYLQQQSIVNDHDQTPGEKGVNFILHVGGATPPLGTATVQGTETAGVPAITLTLKHISLLEALKYITDCSGLKYRIEENVVVIFPADVAYGELETRAYKVQPSVVEAFMGGGMAPAAGGEAGKLTLGGGGLAKERQDMKQFFSNAGIPFPEGTSITYIPAQTLLIVKNTVSNLDVFERLLQKLNVGPMVVSLEMRMIEIPRLAADELFKEQGGLAKTYVINEKTLGAISEMVIKNKAKVVSQSKIMTKSGASCENKAVGEFIYPTAYDVRGSGATNGIQALPGSRSGATNSVTVPPGILVPSEFETRDYGTILQLTPTVGPDNETINIDFVSQRVRLSAYPNKVIINSPAGKTEVEQPVFLSDSVTTSLSMQSGATVLASVCDAIADQEKPEKAGANVILIIVTTCVLPVNAGGAP